MPANLTKQGQEKGCDTSYRARSFDTHLTHACIQLLRHFRGGLSARASLQGSKTRANQPNYERVNGALMEVLS